MSARGDRDRRRQSDIGRPSDSRIVELLKRELERLREEVAEKDRQIDKQKERITDLERQLAARKRNSTNSSKPPFSDGLAGKQRRRCAARRKSGRKPGGQPGHTGHERPRVENPDRVEEVLPQECKHCGTALPQAPEERQTAGDIFLRQIVDLPEVILPTVTEYQYPKLVCPGCRKETRAALRPAHEHDIGERLTGVISYLIAARKMTRRGR